MSTFCPTAAAACCVARSVGRSSRRRNGSPVAMAPLDTSTTSVPRACDSESASTRSSICDTRAALTDDEPTLTTTRLARGMCSRPWSGGRVIGSVIGVRTLGSLVGDVCPQARLTLALQFGTGLGLRVHAFEVALAALLARRATRSAESRVAAPWADDEFRSRGARGLPVEHDAVGVADHHGGPGDRADLEQPVLDAKLGETIREKPDGFIVVEVGLCDPPFGLLAPNPVHVSARTALDGDRETGVVD